MTRTLGSALAICHRSGSGSGGGGGTMHKILWSNSIHYCLQSAGPRQETGSKKATLTSERRNTEADSGRGTGFGGRNRIVGGAVIHCRDQSIGVPGRECVRCWLIRVFPAWICSGLAACDGPTSMLLDADRPTALPGRLFERCEALDSNITDLDVPSPGCRAPGGAELGRPTAIAISDAAILLACPYPAPLSSLANLTRHCKSLTKQEVLHATVGVARRLHRVCALLPMIMGSNFGGMRTPGPVAAKIVSRQFHRERQRDTDT